MALYDYELHMARRAEGQPVLAALVDADLLVRAGEDELRLPIGGHGTGREHRWTAEALGRETGPAWQIASIQLEPDFEREATRSFGHFTDWLFACAQAADLDAMFVPPGSDAPLSLRRRAEPEPLASVAALMFDRRLPVAHPVLYLGARQFPAVESTDIDYYHLITRQDVGNLFVFADVRSDGTFDILDPAPFQSAMLRQIRRVVPI